MPVQCKKCNAAVATELQAVQTLACTYCCQSSRLQLSAGPLGGNLVHPSPLFDRRSSPAHILHIDVAYFRCT